MLRPSDQSAVCSYCASPSSIMAPLVLTGSIASFTNHGNLIQSKKLCVRKPNLKKKVLFVFIKNKKRKYTNSSTTLCGDPQYRIGFWQNWWHAITRSPILRFFFCDIYTLFIASPYLREKKASRRKKRLSFTLILQGKRYPDASAFFHVYLTLRHIGTFWFWNHSLRIRVEN